MSKWDVLAKHDWYVSGTKFTCWVETDDNLIITSTAPIVYRWKGQPIQKLLDYYNAEATELLYDPDGRTK